MGYYEQEYNGDKYQAAFLCWNLCVIIVDLNTISFRASTQRC